RTAVRDPGRVDRGERVMQGRPLGGGARPPPWSNAGATGGLQRRAPSGAPAGSAARTAAVVQSCTARASGSESGHLAPPGRHRAPVHGARQVVEPNRRRPHTHDRQPVEGAGFDAEPLAVGEPKLDDDRARAAPRWSASRTRGHGAGAAPPSPNATASTAKRVPSSVASPARRPKSPGSAPPACRGTKSSVTSAGTRSALRSPCSRSRNAVVSGKRSIGPRYRTRVAPPAAGAMVRPPTRAGGSTPVRSPVKRRRPPEGGKRRRRPP